VRARAEIALEVKDELEAAICDPLFRGQMGLLVAHCRPSSLISTNKIAVIHFNLDNRLFSSA
jgi:hypothetical protein